MRVCAYACVDSNIYIDSVFKALNSSLAFCFSFQSKLGQSWSS